MLRNAPQQADQLSSWAREPDLVDERTFTTTADPGWSSWNVMSPEREFCELAGALMLMVRPRFVIETGVGQGFVTRRILGVLPQGSRYLGFESSVAWRTSLLSVDVFRHDDSQRISTTASPSPDEWAMCDLAVIDSEGRLRPAEVEAWWEHSPPGSVALIHDAHPDHPRGSNHQKLAAHLQRLGIPGVFFPNPRGSFLGQKSGKA